MCSHSVFPQGWSDDGGFFRKAWRQWGAFEELKSLECCAAALAPRGQQVLFTCWRRWRWSILSGGTACPWCDAWTGSGAGRRRSRCSVCIHHTQTGTGSLGIQGTGNPQTWETEKVRVNLRNLFVFKYKCWVVQFGFPWTVSLNTFRSLLFSKFQDICESLRKF